jgi:hypothetical protein
MSDDVAGAARLRVPYLGRVCNSLGRQPRGTRRPREERLP